MLVRFREAKNVHKADTCHYVLYLDKETRRRTGIALRNASTVLNGVTFFHIVENHPILELWKMYDSPCLPQNFRKKGRK